MTKEEQIKKVKGITQKLANTWLITKHFKKNEFDAVMEFSGWLDHVMENGK